MSSLIPQWEQKKKKKKNTPAKKAANSLTWSKANSNQSNIRPGAFRPSLKQVPFTPVIPQNVVGLNPIRLQTNFTIPRKNVVELVDDNSPKTPGSEITSTASFKTNIVINTGTTTTKNTSTTNTVTNAVASVTKKSTATKIIKNTVPKSAKTTDTTKYVISADKNNIAIIPTKPAMNTQLIPHVIDRTVVQRPLTKKQRKKARQQQKRLDRWSEINRALDAKYAAKAVEEQLAQQITDNPQKDGDKVTNPTIMSTEKTEDPKGEIYTILPATTTAATIITTATSNTIPALNETRRSTAGSFFKTTLSQSKQQQQAAQSWGPINPYPSAYKYPKGIPRSFLTPQQMAAVSQRLTLNLLNSQQPVMSSPQAIQPREQTPITANSPIWPNTSPIKTDYQQQPGQQQPTLAPTPEAQNTNNSNANAPIFVHTDNQEDVQQPYSPSDIYAEQGNNAEPSEDSPDANQGGQKRLSAFQRLGPVSQPKKPKLTINLTLNKEQPVREVVDDTSDDPERYTPVHLRKNIMMSTDETVIKYLPSWPWRKNVGIRRSATARNSRTVMILEQEQMEECYERDNCFIQISVKGYPASWTKERVLDAVLESVKGYSLIPCFTEFLHNECKFLTLRSRSALIILHKTGFYIHKDGVELAITISQTDLSLNQIDFIPRIILRKRIGMAYENQKLNLSAFTLQDDISHFIYFPLSRISNQSEFLQLQSVIDWNHLTSLDLSHNRLTDISGFDLRRVVPRLKHLNLAHNYLDKITILIGCRDLPLKTLHLEGNPLCYDYIDSEHYIKVIRMMFPEVVEIDGVPIHRSGQMPQFKQNYCPDEAREVTEKFLETFFPLIDYDDHRSLLQDMYEDEATLTITYCYKLRYSSLYRNFRNLFLYARFLDEGETDSVMGAMAITKLINRWPRTEHDPKTFTVDVMYHTETTTILRISGILRLIPEASDEEEYLLAFTRTVVLYSEDGNEYKIQNEMVYWKEPSEEHAKTAFVDKNKKKIHLKIESTTDEDLREKLLTVFMKLTTMEKKISQRCLETNNWNFKLALEHFTKLLKCNNLSSLFIQEPVPVNDPS